MIRRIRKWLETWSVRYNDVESYGCSGKIKKDTAGYMEAETCGTNGCKCHWVGGEKDGE